MITAKDILNYSMAVYFAIKNKPMTRTKEFARDQYNESWFWAASGDLVKWRQQVNNVLRQWMYSLEYDSVLEVGCGLGQNLRRLQQQDGAKRYCGLDISDVGIQRAKNYGDGIEYVCCSADEIPFDVVDVVFTVHALEQMEHCVDGVLRELYRVTGKRLILIEPFFEHQNMFGKAHHRHHDYVRNLVEKVKSVGFKPVFFKRLPFSTNNANKSSVLVCVK
jgi:ubiquinone/menaquinone biosynthesis C-methylase UbiE